MNSADHRLAKIEKNNRMRRDLEERLRLDKSQALQGSKPKENAVLLVDRNKQALKDIQAQAAAKTKSGKVAKIVIVDIAIGALSFLGM